MTLAVYSSHSQDLIGTILLKMIGLPVVIEIFLMHIHEN